MIAGFLGHGGTVSGFWAVIGYAPARRATLVLPANKMVALNTLLIEGLSADRMAATILRTLFPTSTAAPPRTVAAAAPPACR